LIVKLPAPAQMVDDNLVKDINLARRDARRFMQEYVGEGAGEIHTLLNDRRKALLKIDPTWSLTSAFFPTQNGPHGEARIRKHVFLGLLPTPPNNVALADAIGALASLERPSSPSIVASPPPDFATASWACL
jgi:hypothetical protein